MELAPRKIRPDWACFFIFLATNIFLAYGPFSLTAKLWVGLLGLMGPFTWALYRQPAAKISQKPFYLQEFLPVPPAWFGALILAGGIFLRFYKLTSLSAWPNPDESLFAFIAYHISRHWEWAFFYTHAQIPFTFLWEMAFVIKIFGLSLATLWAYPAALSCFYVPLAYLAARQFFATSLAALLSVLFAFSYWGIYAGRIGNSTALCPLIELLVLYLFGKFLKDVGEKAGKKNGLGLGLGIGLGFYVYPPAWAPLASWLVASVLKISLERRKKNRGTLFCFWTALGLLLLPFILFAVRDHYGSYLGNISIRHPSQLNFGQLLVSVSYLSGLFWGKMDGDYYGPYWGGLFDPVSGALFFVGAIQCWRHRKDGLIRWTLVACALALLPGVCSGNLEFFRIFFTFPFFLLLMAFGIESLSSGFPSKSAAAIVGVLFLALLPLNVYQLFGPYHRYWENPGPSWGFYKSPENFRAYQMLEKVSLEKGPGYIFQDFPSDMSDQSLTVATYSFNQAMNPQPGQPDARWFAVLANDNYGPFLLQRFPGGRWFSLSRDLNREDGGLGLGLFPLSSIPAETLKSWIDTNNAFGETAYAFLNRPTGTDYKQVLQVLEQSKPLVQGDPFLASCFWEKAYYLYLQNGAFGDRQKEENFKNSFQALQQALVQGYPAAH
ncbi:MAG TPA: hypothetical protein VK859_02000, partial [bacterium]|nr:hypothetical protein [bacterium]